MTTMMRCSHKEIGGKKLILMKNRVEHKFELIKHLNELGNFKTLKDVT